mmetsp:Transcript_48814/g.97733  ORF Transcript_48814/g.97733 Transcript_48814/m.97733 type:complete len:133 (-) Transcript_48814:174-572(-)
MWPRKIKFLKKKSLIKDRNKNKISNIQTLEYRKIQAFSKLQALRYGFFRRSDLKKEKVKKIISNINPFLKNVNSSDPLIISIKGLAKFFIGELTETTKQIMFEQRQSVEWTESPLKISFALSNVKSFSLLKF